MCVCVWSISFLVVRKPFSLTHCDNKAYYTDTVYCSKLHVTRTHHSEEATLISLAKKNPPTVYTEDSDLYVQTGITSSSDKDNDIDVYSAVTEK